MLQHLPPAATTKVTDIFDRDINNKLENIKK